MEQETLIYVEENDKAEARILSQSFAKKEVKSRAYVNALGAELGMKYLALENINNSRLYNMHSIHKILEEFDISDIMLNNIHIDVRVVFDENYIFVPKSHFEYDILPDIYFVLLLAEDHSHASFLGFFEPKLINKNNQNANYYFIEKEKLTAPSNLKSYIESFKGNTTQSLSDSENEKAEILMVSMADQNISDAEVKELLKLLSKSADLRDKFIEFENFELLAYKAEHSPNVKIPEIAEQNNEIDVTIDELTGQDLDLAQESVEELSDLSADLDTTLEDAEEMISNPQELDSSLPDVMVEEEADEMISDVADIAEVSNNTVISNEVPLVGGSVVGKAVDGAVDVLADAANSVVNSLDMAVEESNISEDFQATNLEEILADTVEADVLPTSIDELVETKEVLLDDSLDVDSNLKGDVSLNLEDNFEQTPFSEDEEMADLEQLTAKASAGTFAEASLDELGEFGEDTGELSSIEALQEENAIRKGLLQSMDDESILENSLDFSKVEAVPQVDMNKIKNSLDTVDISGFDSIAPEVHLEEASQLDDLGVLDISDVEAHPNNFGANISETIEFNNIEQVDNTCENQKNKQVSAPTANFSAMGGLEPLDMGDNLFIDDNAMLDSMDLTAPVENKPAASKRPASPMEVDLSGFQSLDMEEFSYVPLAEAQKDTSIPVEKEEEDLASALLGDLSVDGLDSIPDFNGGGNISLSLDDETPEVANAAAIPDGSLADNPPGEPEMLDLNLGDIPAPAKNVQDSPAQVEEIENLSADDIIDSPEESDVDVDLLSQAVDIDVQDTINQEQNAENTVTVSELPQTSEVKDVNAGEAPVSLSEVGEDANIDTQKSSHMSAIAAAVQNASSEASLDDIDALTAMDDTSFSEGSDSDLQMLFEETIQGGMADSVIDESYVAEETSGFVPTLPHLPQKQSGGKGKMIGAALLVALLAAGTFVGLNMKNKNELADVEAITQPLSENNEVQAQGEVAAPADSAQVETPASNADLMANAPEVIDMPQNQVEPTNVKKENPKDTKAAANKPVNPEGSIMSVKKLSWELPDYLSYSQEMKKYLQTAGRSIKLTLTSDLLLASEYAYSNQVKVSLNLSKDGAIQSSKIEKSSGSTEIDNIVLRTVKETLNVVKPTPGEVPTPDFNLGLIINF